MALFKKKTPEYVDLGEKLRKKEQRISNFKQNNSSEQTLETTNHEQPATNPSSTDSSGGFFGFFGGSGTASQTQSQPEQETRKIKISDKLREMTTRLEEQENEIYKLKKRLEILEKKQRLSY